MAVLDEEGRLFGVVNVVDAVVVLVVLAMIVAGGALLAGGEEESEPPEPARYGTVAYEAPLGTEAAALSTEHTLTPSNGGEPLTVSDVYRSFTSNGTAHVVASVGYRGTFQAGGSDRYGGDSIPLHTDAYRVDADVLDVDVADGTIPTRTEQVVLRANLSAPAAAALAPGTNATIGNTTVGTITHVDEETSGTDRTRVRLGVHVTVRERAPVASFGGSAIRLDDSLRLVTDRVSISGDIAAIGTDDPTAIG